MPTQAEETTPTPTPQVVGNAFVEQYYNMLSQSPEMVHKFYHNSGVISRPDLDGLMMTASTLEGIEKMILSHDYKNCVVQILSTDAQESFGDGVIVLVIGFITGKDNVRRKFTQFFFLAPQASHASFSVLNDVLRFVDEEETTPVKINDTDDTTLAAPSTPNPAISEPTMVSNNSVLSLEEVDVVQPNECSYPLDKGKIFVADKEVVNTNVNDGTLVSTGTDHADAHPDATIVPDDTPKKSYASVANALNHKKQPFHQRALPPKPIEQPRPTVIAAPETSPPPASIKLAEKVVLNGHSIFVANLPMDATVEQLIDVFEKFGPIKPNGVQVRSYKQEKNCFGFVEFESASSMQSAVQVSSLKIGDRMAHIEEKKANNEGGKFPNRKDGFRGDNFRSRGNFSGSCTGYWRNESDNQVGSSGQWPGVGGGGRRNGYAYQKVYQNGIGRAAPQEGYSLADAQAEGGKS